MAARHQVCGKALQGDWGTGPASAIAWEAAPVVLSAQRILLEAKPDDDDGPRRFVMNAYTGQPVARMFGDMVLELSGFEMPDRLPMLLNHDADQVVGFADSLSVDNGQLQLSGVIVEAEDAGRRVANLGDAGFPLTASVGVLIEKTEHLDDGEEREVNGRKLSGPMLIATKLRLFETSFITAGPADDQTSAEVLTLEEETPMDAVAFAKDNPEAVGGWRDEGSASLRVELAQVLEALPEDRRGWAAVEFSKGKTLTEIKASLSDVLMTELHASEARATKLEAATSKHDAVSVALAAVAGNPGVGFNGSAHQSTDGKTDLSHLPFEERCAAEWGQDVKLQAEFAGRFGAYVAWAGRNAAGV